MDRRQALRLLATLGAAGVASACGAPAPVDPTRKTYDSPVRIGMLVPQTGGYKPIGDDILNGFQLFLDLHGRRLGGHPAELVVADEGDRVDSGKASLQTLIDKGVLALTGVVNSDVMLAIRDAVEKARIPLVGSNASPVSLQGVIYIWRTSFVNDEPGRALGGYVARRVSGKIGLIAPDYTAGHDSIDGFRQTFGPRDKRLTDPIWTPNKSKPGPDFFRSALYKLHARNADAVYCFFAGAAGVEFVRQYRAAGLRAPIYAPGFLTEGSALAELGKDAEGIYTAMNYSADLANGANRTFAAAYRRAYNASPSTYAVASYDAAAVLDRAIRLTGEQPTPQQVNLNIGKIGQIDSPRGPWQFNQSRTPQQTWYLRQVRLDGQVLSNVLIGDLTTLG